MISKEESLFFQLDDFSSNWKKYFWIKLFNQPNLFNTYGYYYAFLGLEDFVLGKRKLSVPSYWDLLSLGTVILNTGAVPIAAKFHTVTSVSTL